jgi:hypothetical protein
MTKAVPAILAVISTLPLVAACEPLAAWPGHIEPTAVPHAPKSPGLSPISILNVIKTS